MYNWVTNWSRDREKGSERVSGLIPKNTTILGVIKSKINPVVFPLSAPYVSHIIKLVECQLYPIINKHLHYSKDFFNLINEAL